MNRICLLILLLSPALLWAQSSVLQRYVEQGISNNLSLSRKTSDLDLQRLKEQQATAAFYPSVSLESSYLLADGGRTIDIPIGSLVNPINRTLNELSGGTNLPTTIENRNEQFLPNNFHDTRLQVQQPLFNTDIYYNQKAQELLISVEEARLRVARAGLRRDIKVAYFNYLKTLEVLQIYDSTEQVLQEVLRVNRKLVQYDKATKDIIFTVQFELEQLRSDRAQTVQQQQLAKSYFNTLLNRDLQAVIEPGAPDVPSTRFQIDSLTRVALAGRAELLQLDRALLANEALTELYDKRRLPSIGLQAQAGFQGFGFHFDAEQRYATLGFSMSWTLYSGKQVQLRTQQAQVENRKLRQERSIVEQQIQLQVIEAYYKLQAQRQRVEAQQAALRAARNSFSIIRNKYENEQVLLVELLDARNRLVNSRIQVSIAKYDLLAQVAELQRAANL